MRRGAATALALFFAGAAYGHDFWLEPSTFHPSPGETVSVGLRVGQNFAGDPVPRSAYLLERFLVRQGNRIDDVPGSENGDPAGFFRADARMTSVVAYVSRPVPVVMPAAQFEEYLRQQGLESVIEVRARRREHGRQGREMFVRCAKAILGGGRPSLAAAQPLGLRYEIVPSRDPAEGVSPFRARLLFDRAPLANALVVAMLRDDPRIRLQTRSDANGTFALALPRAGVWLIQSVQMIAAPAGGDTDWQSFWASLTFDWPTR
ncbi:MAG: DUF4198 domain-containing protein [Acidobacteria bacterium]|nr:DUF4198 domain-containing protein [Acidobacteriota bacterium]